MELADILKLDLEDAWAAVTTKPDREVSLDEIQAQLDPNEHAIFDKTKRPDKLVKREKGKALDGKPIIEETTESVNRIAIAYQPLIVNRTVGFVLGNPVTLQADADGPQEEELLAMIEKVWEDNKLQYKDRKVARTLFSETEVAEVWYFDEDPDYWEKDNLTLRPKVTVLTPSEGNKLIPKFDKYGDLTMFAREYSRVDFVDGEEVNVEVLEIWTKEKYILLEKLDDIEIVENKVNLIGKIPVIYYSQPLPEWSLVQIMIERLESLISDFGDTNAYFGSPMVFVEGVITGFAEKGEQGKVLQGEKGSKAEYLSWDSAPEAIKLEIETLIELIHTCTQTPNISFSQMKGLGNLSGVALKLMFLDAHMKAEDKIEQIGEMFQRRLNLIKTMCAIADISLEEARKKLNVAPVFKPYLPRNEKEEMETLTMGAGGAVMSKRTAMEYNAYVSDVDREVELLKEEAEAEASRDNFDW